MSKASNNGKGSIGVIGAAAIGVGGMMGAGLYTLVGLASASAGVLLPVSFLVGGIVAAFSVYSYAKLGMKFPSRGGAAEFLLRCFGDGLVSGGMNVFQYLGWIIAMALYATGFAEYARVLFGIHGSPWIGKLIAIGIIAVVVFINIMGSKLVARTQTAIIAFELVILLIFAVVGVTKAHVPEITLSSGSGGILGVLSAAGLLYVTYEGFGVVTNAAGNMANPKKQLPRAMYLALGIVMAVYMVASFVIIATIGVKGAVAAEGHALAAAGRAVLGTVGFTAIGLAALVATASAVNATMFGDVNLGIQISGIQEIPKRFSAKTRVGGTWGIFFTALITVVFVVVFPLSAVGEMASLAFLLVYATVNLGHIRVYKETGAKRWILVLSVLLNLLLFAVLFTQTIVNGEVLTWVSVIVLLVLSFCGEWLWRKRTQQNCKLLGIAR